jgi:hypothetical protein
MDDPVEVAACEEKCPLLGRPLKNHISQALACRKKCREETAATALTAVKREAAKTDVKEDPVEAACWEKCPRQPRMMISHGPIHDSDTTLRCISKCVEEAKDRAASSASGATTTPLSNATKAFAIPTTAKREAAKTDKDDDPVMNACREKCPMPRRPLRHHKDKLGRVLQVLVCRKKCHEEAKGHAPSPTSPKHATTNTTSKGASAPPPSSDPSEASFAASSA